jgi:hypothetical protein
MHAPTKTVLDRCEVIAEKLEAQPVIINTAELCSSVGYVPFCSPRFGRYFALTDGQVSYRGKTFLYKQCSENMPNDKELLEVISYVRGLNPYCLILVGGNSICADLCSNYYPLMTVGTVPSSVVTTEGQFVLTGREIADEEVNYANRLGFSKDYIQHCTFTWSVKPQKESMTREQYHIPTDSFTVLLVGARLDFEIDAGFVEGVLNPVMEAGIIVVFMGVFEQYDSLKKKYPLLRDCSVFIGFIEDVLAVNELCDVYVNPKRRGGGTSVVEAMVKGIPPVTLHYGDVALGSGEEFWVEDYDGMVKQIMRLKEDSEYYALMSQKARERAEVVMDSKKTFWEAFQYIETLPDFQ